MDPAFLCRHKLWTCHTVIKQSFFFRKYMIPLLGDAFVLFFSFQIFWQWKKENFKLTSEHRMWPYHVHLVNKLNILESFLKLRLCDPDQLLSVFIHVSPSKYAGSKQAIEISPQEVPASENTWKFSEWTTDTFQNNLRKYSKSLRIETVTFNCLRMFLHIT